MVIKKQQGDGGNLLATLEKKGSFYVVTVRSRYKNGRLTDVMRVYDKYQTRNRSSADDMFKKLVKKF